MKDKDLIQENYMEKFCESYLNAAPYPNHEKCKINCTQMSDCSEYVSKRIESEECIHKKGRKNYLNESLIGFCDKFRRLKRKRILNLKIKFCFYLLRPRIKLLFIK